MKNDELIQSYKKLRALEADIFQLQVEFDREVSSIEKKLECGLLVSDEKTTQSFAKRRAVFESLKLLIADCILEGNE